MTIPTNKQTHGITTWLADRTMFMHRFAKRYLLT